MAPLLAVTLLLAAGLHAQEVPAPEDVIGFVPGTAHELADYGQLEAYYRALAEASDRVQLEVIGRTHQGRDLLLLTISSQENLRNLDRLREISARLARARDVSEGEARRLAREGRTVVWIDHGMHSHEPAHAQAGPHLAYHMAVDESEETRRIRDDVILLLMPNMNPDGHDINVSWYQETRDTPWAETVTGGPPWVWHEYVDHDVNRDWYMLLQNESRAVARVIYNSWYPQIVLNHHQMGEMPPRILVGRYAEPVNPNIPPLAIRGTNLVGEHMAARYDTKDMPGVIQGVRFNMWWNGGMRTAPYFHNMVGILTESTHRSPIPRFWTEDDIPEALPLGRGGQEVPMRRPSVNYPNPWLGGESSLMQMIQYHHEGSLAVLDVASLMRETWLMNFWRMGQQAIQRGQEGGPFAYIVPEEQWDAPEAAEMLRSLHRGGIEIHRATSSFSAGGRTYPAGTRILYAGQAFRAHLVDMMEPQEYPDMRVYPGGPPEPPQDMAGWTLWIQMGVDVHRIDEPFQARTEELREIPTPAGGVARGSGNAYLLSPRSNLSATAVFRLLEEGHTVRRAAAAFEAGGRSWPAGTFVVEGSGGDLRDGLDAMGRELGIHFVPATVPTGTETRALTRPRIAKYRSWMGNIDGGWTRWIFDNYQVPYQNLSNREIQEGALSRFDVLVMPAQDPETILRGHEPGRMPEPYVGGLGARGAAAVEAFVREGGTVVAWDGATDFLMDMLEIPVRNRVAGIPRDRFFIPGSLVRLQVDPDHPLGYGMQSDAGAWFVERRGSRSRAFQVIQPAAAGDRRGTPPRVETIARFADEGILLSGWALGEDAHLAGAPAAVRVRLGEGNLILIGIRPQFRAQPRGTFKLIFNGLLSGADPLPGG